MAHSFEVARSASSRSAASSLASDPRSDSWYKTARTRTGTPGCSARRYNARRISRLHSSGDALSRFDLQGVPYSAHRNTKVLVRGFAASLPLASRLDSPRQKECARGRARLASPETTRPAPRALAQTPMEVSADAH